MDQGLVKLIPSARASECLIQCKQDNFELAMIGGFDQRVQTKDKLFECTCIQRDFYKFNMQDFSLSCTDVSFKCNVVLTPWLSEIIQFIILKLWQSRYVTPPTTL